MGIDVVGYIVRARVGTSGVDGTGVGARVLGCKEACKVAGPKA
jgi:hypothetical protein